MNVAEAEGLVVSVPVKGKLIETPKPAGFQTCSGTQVSVPVKGKLIETKDETGAEITLQ